MHQSIVVTKAKTCIHQKVFNRSGVAGIFIFGDSVICKGCMFWTFLFALPFELCCRRGNLVDHGRYEAIGVIVLELVNDNLLQLICMLRYEMLKCCGIYLFLSVQIHLNWSSCFFCCFMERQLLDFLT